MNSGLRKKWEGTGYLIGWFDEWNGLSHHIVSAESMGGFKRRLDKFMHEDDSGIR